MSSLETQQAVVRLGSAHVVVCYPRQLGIWFGDQPNAATPDAGVAPAKRFSILAGTQPNRFTVVSNCAATSSPDLDLGDALATLWEQIAFDLVKDLDDSLALHAAALSHPSGQVLLPGQSGAGKTRLALWFRTKGFELGTDEVVAVSIAQHGSTEALVTSALARPIILKDVADAAALLRPEEQSSIVSETSGSGLVAKLPASADWTPRSDRTLIVFPKYIAGASLSLTGLTAAQTGLRVIGNCINWRNLPNNGLSIASAIARHAVAVDLVYGDSGQLDGCLDVLTRQVLAARPSRDDLAVLCAAFTAQAATHRAPGVVPARHATPRHTSTALPVPAAAGDPFRLTIGMATYDDYDGVYFTIQAIRAYHPELHGALEFVVIDNNPEGPCAEALIDFGKSIEGYRYVPRGDWNGTAIRNLVFEEASSKFVLCVDSHVLIVPGALSKLIAYLDGAAESRDLIQGPLLYDDLRSISTHMEPTWRSGMYGIWASDARGSDPQASPFEIPMQGLGLFACRRDAWAQFNPAFRGFGGEEGYIHEKTRRRGGRVVCLPALRWLHRFGRPLGLRYQNRWEDRIRNYLIGFTELGLDTTEMETHFTALLGAAEAGRCFEQVRQELGLARVGAI